MPCADHKKADRMKYENSLAIIECRRVRNADFSFRTVTTGTCLMRSPGRMTEPASTDEAFYRFSPET